MDSNTINLPDTPLDGQIYWLWIFHPFGGGNDWIDCTVHGLQKEGITIPGAFESVIEMVGDISFVVSSEELVVPIWKNK